MLTKEEVIKVLQKLAKENGGRTPSAKKFKEITEIGTYELQKYSWSNYGELVLEAGLAPNLFDKTKYSYQDLCKVFIRVIREKGKWPTRAVLDIKHLHNPKFPASATFYKKLGQTGDLALTILEYIKDKQGYKDVVNICTPVLEKYKNESETSEDDKVEGGFVYLGSQHGDHKIGFTKDLDRRREDITLLGSGPMVWIAEIETDDMRGVERYWHNRFKSKWIRGEWYKLSPSDVKAFKRWKRIF